LPRHPIDPATSPVTQQLSRFSPELTDPVVAASKWSLDERGARYHAYGRAIFVSVRPGMGEDGQKLVGRLFVHVDGETSEIGVANDLIFVKQHANVALYYADPNGDAVHLFVPIAEHWDTHIFILLGRDGRPSLSSASVSMRPAGEGFDPSDALIDAYERAVADLVTGGPGPDAATLDALLWGKYRNPLFGLVGVGGLLGHNAPDVAALRLRRAELLGIDADGIEENMYSAIRERGPPLFRASFDAFIAATARSKIEAPRQLSVVAIGIDPSSPWACWRSSKRYSAFSGGYNPDTQISRLTLQLPRSTLSGAIKALWLDAGCEVTTLDMGDEIVLEGKIVGTHYGETMQATSNMLAAPVPKWLVDYMKDIDLQSQRTGLAPKLSAIVRRTGMPAAMIAAARLAASNRLIERIRGELIDPERKIEGDGGGRVA
jgi:hypothetical protein